MQPVSKFACPTSHHYGMRRQPMVAPTPRTRAAAAAAAKLLQSCPTLCDPIDSLPPGSPVWDSPGKNTGVRCHFLFQSRKVKSESEVVQSCLTLSDPMDCSLPGSFIHGIFQARYWSGVPRPSPHNEPAAAAAAKSLQSCPTLFDPIDSLPPGSPVPGILQAKTLEWVAISFSNS